MNRADNTNAKGPAMNRADHAPDVAIYLAYHKNSQRLASGVLRPVHVGRALADDSIRALMADMPGDDTGDNISAKNPLFCELTLQYWVWKNRMDADYIGFLHYRRQLNFNPAGASKPLDEWGNQNFKTLGPETVEACGLNDDAIRRAVAGADVVTVKPWNVVFKGSASNYDHYAHSDPKLHIADYDRALAILKERFPDYAPDADAYNAAKTGYYTNIFVMRRDIFARYMEYLFGILSELEKRLDLTDYSVQERRVFGYVSEWLFGIFLTHLRRTEPGLRILELPRTFIADTDVCATRIDPYFDRTDCALVLSSNDAYIPYVSVLLESVRAHADPAKNYDCIVLSRSISAGNRALLVREFADAPNISIRFFDVTGYVRGAGDFPLTDYFSVETYYRFFIPEIMPGYEKALYLDADVIVMDDLAKLYAVDPGDCPACAVVDVDHAGAYATDFREMRIYTDEVLKLANPYDYFQAGVMLFNIPVLRAGFSVDDMLKLAFKRKWDYLDQDVLNILFAGRMKFLDLRWNVLYDCDHFRVKELVANAPQRIYDAYMASRKDPGIIHFAGYRKPWDDPAVDFAQEFWANARRSPFYELILYRMAHPRRPEPAAPKKEPRTLRSILLAPFKFFVPYGLMCVWLRKRYDMMEDVPLMAYPNTGKRIRRAVKFMLPYGPVKLWKEVRYHE